MSVFQIHLHDLEAGPVDKSFEPTRGQLEELFAAVLDDFDLGDPDDFEAEVRARESDATVYVTGRVAADFTYECGRCLSRRELAIDTDLDFVLMSEDEWSTAYDGEDEIALEEDEMNVSYYEGQTLDLGELLREAVLLEFPSFPRCPDDLRDECDARYQQRVGDETLGELEDQKVDLRLSPLKDLEVTENGEVKWTDDPDRSESEDHKN